jgi:outer membrane autotransporter protein
VQPYGALVAEKELLDGGRSVTFSQTSAPTIVNSWDFDDRSKKVYGRFNAGLSAGLLSNVAIDGAVSMTFGNNEETSGHLGLKVGF